MTLYSQSALAMRMLVLLFTGAAACSENTAAAPPRPDPPIVVREEPLLVSEYWGIFDDGIYDTFAFPFTTDPPPPYTAWDITCITGITVTQVDGFWVATYENDRGGQPVQPNDDDQDRIAELVSNVTAGNNSMRFFITLEWGNHEFSNGASNPTEFAASVAQIIRENGLDGFDVDFESDGMSKESFAAVSQALRSQLDAAGAAMGKQLYLSFTPNDVDDIDLGTLNTYWDYVQMQSYSSQVDEQFDPSALVGQPGIDNSKLLFGRDIGDGDTLDASGYGIEDVASYVTTNGLGGLMGYRVNAHNQMDVSPPLYSGVNLLGNAFEHGTGCSAASVPGTWNDGGQCQNIQVYACDEGAYTLCANCQASPAAQTCLSNCTSQVSACNGILTCGDCASGS